MTGLTESGIQEIKSHAAEEPALHDLDASKLQVTYSTTPCPVPELNSKEVWKAPAIVPYGPLTSMPTASCLHYATQCFEGMEVFRGFDGKLRLFRPDRNCERLLTSSTRVALPPFDPVEWEKILKAFLAVDGPRRLPKSRPGTFLYLRPTVIGNGEHLGVTTPSEVLLFILAVPWPDYSSDTPPGESPKPPGLKLLASKNDTRAWPGGFGYAKVGANYGPAFVSHMEGRKRGYDQILWLLNDKQGYETKDGKLELVTAPLDSKIILDGVTRRSVLDLARERLVVGSGHLTADVKSVDVVERMFTMLEIEHAQREGRLVEAFLSGTAYFITPVSAISFKDEELAIPIGYYFVLLKKWLKDIICGYVEHPWGIVVKER